MSNPQDYIGDGVYVEFDGYGVTAWTMRTPEGMPNYPQERHYIYFEPKILENLNRFYKKVITEQRGETTE